MEKDRSKRADFNRRFETAIDPALLSAEKEVMGTDYGTTSYTTRSQADNLARRLELGSGKRLLDIGSGTGWPALYLAKSTGCHVTLTDPTSEGASTAGKRIGDDALSATALLATGNALPFRDEAFHATTSGDVFC